MELAWENRWSAIKTGSVAHETVAKENYPVNLYLPQSISNYVNSPIWKTLEEIVQVIPKDNVLESKDLDELFNRKFVNPELKRISLELKRVLVASEELREFDLAWSGGSAHKFLRVSIPRKVWCWKTVDIVKWLTQYVKPISNCNQGHHVALYGRGIGLTQDEVQRLIMASATPKYRSTRITDLKQYRRDYERAWYAKHHRSKQQEEDEWWDSFYASVSEPIKRKRKRAKR